MSSPASEQIAQLEMTIAALEAQRTALGDAIVEASLAPLQTQLDLLRSQNAPVAMTEAGLRAQLDHLNQADLIRPYASEPELAYIFKHALIQQAAYDSMLNTVRRAVHERVAQACERLYADRLDQFAGVLAHHYAQAGNDAKTYVYAMRAADLAARQSAYSEARSHYSTALNALAHLPDSVENQRTRVNIVIKQLNVA